MRLNQITPSSQPIAPRHLIDARIHAQRVARTAAGAVRFVRTVRLAGRAVDLRGARRQTAVRIEDVLDVDARIGDACVARRQTQLFGGLWR